MEVRTERREEEQIRKEVEVQRMERWKKGRTESNKGRKN